MPVTVARTRTKAVAETSHNGTRALEVLLTTIDDYDTYTGGHSDRVATFSEHIARLLGLSYATVDLVKRAAFVHDIGKIFIPDSIVQKPGPLSPEEREVVEQHPVLGARMLARRPAMSDLASIVLHHHERWDGRGYPDGLAGTDIPIESRVIFVADAFDAMTSERPYGRVFGYKEAGAELRRCSGADFDPQVVRAMRLALSSGSLHRAEGRSLQSTSD
jgi:polar amino acid transport system substrate-binding protein